MRLSILANASAFPLLFVSQLVSAQTFNPDEVIVPEPMVAELNEESSSQADIDRPVDQIDELPEPMVVKGQLGASFTTGEGMGYGSSFGSLSGFVPFLQDPGNSLWYFNGRMNLDTENGDFGSNSVIGYRQYSPAADIVFGGYVGFDTKNTVNDSIFSQIGLGFEALGNPWEFRANGYIPVGDRRSLIFDTLTGAVPSFAFQGHFLGYTAGGVQIFEESLIGLDLEAGTRLFDWGSGNLRGYIGTYLYDTPSGSGFIGLSGRLLAQVSDNFNAGVSLTTDHEFGTNLTFTVSADIGGAPKAKSGQSETESVVARLGDALNRQTNVAVRQVEESTFVSGFVTNPETSDPWYFVHVSPGVNSDGSFEDPFGTMDEAIAVAPPQSIIYVDDFVETPGDFTLPTTIQLLSRGPSQFIDTVEFGTLQIPLSGNGNFPFIAGTVTLSGDNVLSGFRITPPTGQAAVVANGGSNFSIRYNTITDTVLEGSDKVAAIDLTNVFGEIEILSNEISNVDLDGIYIEVAPASEATVTILENVIDTTGEHGIHLDGYESTAITATITGNQLSNIGSDGILVENTYVDTSNVTIADNTIKTIGGSGIVLDNYDSGPITAIITGNQLSNISSDGILVENAYVDTSNVTVSDNTIDTAAGNGIVLDNYDIGSITATITGNQLSNISSDGILIENAYVDTSNVTVADNTISGGGDDGIDIYNYYVETSDVTVSNNTISAVDDDGIDFDNVYIETSNVTVSNNRISAVDDDGIDIYNYDVETSNVTVSNNTVSDLTENGIIIGNLYAGISNVTVSDNTISNVTYDGIFIENEYIEASNVTVSDNTIDTTGGNGIVLDNYDSGSITATITGNQLSNIEGDDNNGALNEILNEIFNVNPEGILPDRAGIIVDNEYIGTSNITVANNEISTSVGSETEKYATVVGIYNIEVDNAIVSVSGNTASAGSIRIGNYNVPDATTTIGANTITDGSIGFLEGSIDTDRISTVTITNNQVDAAESKYAIAKVSLGKYGEVEGNTTISGNTVSNASIGIGYLSAGFNQTATSNVTISDNTVSNAGIGVGNLSIGKYQTVNSNVTISSNNISDVDSGGVKYASIGKYQIANSNVTISGNNISNAKYGIGLLQGLTGASSSRSLSATISENTISNVDDSIRFDQFSYSASVTQEATLTIDGNTIQNVTDSTLDLSQDDNYTSGSQSLCAASISGNSFDTGADIIFDNLNGVTPGGSFNVVDLIALEADPTLNIIKDGTITNNPSCN